MSQLTKIIAIILGAYLFGSIPTSYIFGRMLKGIDIREHGSGNVGATNALRILGTKIGVITLLLDMFKGFLPVYIAMQLFAGNDLVAIGAGIATILGHIFTIYLSFKGGKGVATSAGVFIALLPMAIVLCLAVFIIIVAITRYVSLGSIVAAITLFGYELISNIRNDFQHLWLLLFVTILVLMIILRHTANIKRLIAGTENKISFKK
ncbi:MAG: glycerol-3-phosphate 1-O-acyltransferase PlsY [Candidatus Cloacimonetes bacterium]|nr:glycerol-3-phosphate 1-O-acyltransferase PlsY [Candidatus Cloacimonadota bacterium]